MKTISQIAAEITTTFTNLESGKCRIEMSHPSGLSKLAFFSQSGAKNFARALQGSMVTRIANSYEIG